MSRDTMATLIGYVRDMIGDVAGGVTQFTDDQIQQRLDETRTFVNYGVLRAERQPAPGTGFVAYSDFFSNVGYWEDAPVTQLYGPSYEVLAPLSSDTLTGHWSFDPTPPGQVLPVYIKGYFYDNNAAAAALCTRWAAALARSYDISSGSQRLSRSQMRQGLLELAGEYRRQSRPRTVPIVNGDEPVGPWPTHNDDGAPWNW